MAITLPASPYWQLRLGAVGEAVTGLEDIEQCLQIIVTTQPGSDPLRPEFGCDLLPDLDRPWSVAVPSIVRQISRAIARWEPRAELQKVQVVRGDAPSAATLRLLWHPATESPASASSSPTTQTTEIPLGAARRTPTLPPSVSATITLSTPGPVQAGEAEGLTASVPRQEGASYLWTCEGGTILAGKAAPTVVFAAGEADGEAGALVRLACTVTIPEAGLQATGTAALEILPYPRTATLDPGTLAPGAAALGVIQAGAEILVSRIAATAPCRVRIYASAAQRYADSTRPAGTAILGSPETHGLIAESVHDASHLDVLFVPRGHGRPAQGTAYWAITNLAPAAANPVVTVYFQQQE